MLYSGTGAAFGASSSVGLLTGTIAISGGSTGEATDGVSSISSGVFGLGT